MSQLWSDFTQPASAGGTVDVIFLGDNIFNLDDTVWFLKYGVYKVQQVNFISNPLRGYKLRLLAKDSPAISVVPRATFVQAEGDGVTHSTLPYNSTIFLNFREDDYRSLLLTGNIVFAAQQHAPAKSITVRVRNLSGTLSRTLSFPTSWIFLGTAGRPASLLPSRTAILSITSFGTSDGDVIAAWAAQA